MDRSRELPEVLIEKILLSLPTFDAVRTCVLSKHWQYKWTMLPKLLLNVSFFMKIRSIKEDPTFNYVHIVNSILRQHRGPLEEFFLVIPDLPYPERDENISQAIRTVLMRGVEKLTLYKCGGQPYIWPLSFPPSPTLMLLELRYCEIKREPFSRGFQNLIGLVFDNVKCDPCTLSNCIYNSPNLEKIVLWNLEFDGHLPNILSPNLDSFVTRGRLNSIDLQQGKNLKEMGMYLHFGSKHSERDTEHMSDFSENLSQLATLNRDDRTYKLYQAAVFLRDFPRDIGQSRVFRLSGVDFGDALMLRCFLCIIHNFHRLQRLEILANAVYLPGREEMLQFMLFKDNILEHLRKVYIGPISGTSHEVSVIKHLLRCSPALEEMSICNVRWPHCEMFSKLLARFHRASSSVVINVFSCYRDNYFQT